MQIVRPKRIVASRSFLVKALLYRGTVASILCCSFKILLYVVFFYIYINCHNEDNNVNNDNHDNDDGIVMVLVT